MKALLYALAFLLGRLTYILMKLLGISATTFPGKLATTICPSFLSIIPKKARHIIMTTGTNGKTTTNNLLAQILQKANYSVMANLEGANLKSGIATAYLKNPKRFDFACIESDEGIFPSIVGVLKPQTVVVTNFFRDQLDRYGEIDTTVQKIINSLKEIDVTLFLNADDPFVSRLASIGKTTVFYSIPKPFQDSQSEEIRESVYCPDCGKKLSYAFFHYAQIGQYACDCGFKNPPPKYTLTDASYDKVWRFKMGDKAGILDFSFAYGGIYNLYNVLAAYSVTRELSIDRHLCQNAINSFQYRLGRLEKFFYREFEKTLLLVKNPAGYNQALDMVIRENGDKQLLLILNDRIADGTDVSWIWDVDFEKLTMDCSLKQIICSGDRAHDLRLRLKYAGLADGIIQTIPDNRKALETVFPEPLKTIILPTYTALFYSRNILLKLEKEA